MKPVNIFLSPFAYYVRLNVEAFEENQKKGNFQKWIDNDKGLLPYEFIEFRSLDNNLGMKFPREIKKLGLLGSNVYCHHPFNYRTSASTMVFEPVRIISDYKDEIHLIFEKGQSSRINRHEKYYTKEEQPFITRISFHIDDSTINLNEKVEYSDNSEKTSDYHLISKYGDLRKPKGYALFDFN
jgi:hypothetical protein